MKRVQIQLEESVYDQLRHRAFQQKKSIARIIRESIKKEMTLSERAKLSSVKDFKFIASGRSKQGTIGPVSERHDEALQEAFEE